MATFSIPGERSDFIFRAYDYDSDRIVERHVGTGVKDRPFRDKDTPKLVAMDAALRNLPMYLSSRHSGRYHTVWHLDAQHERVIVCEWRNSEPKVIATAREVSLKQVYDLIEQHTIYLPAIVFDGDPT